MIELIRKPSFDRREYIKHVKSADDHDERFECLKNNKTIHILIQHKYSIDLLENIAILVHNLQGTSTNVVFFQFGYGAEYAERFFMYYYELLKNFTVIKSLHGTSNKIYENLRQRTDDIYCFFTNHEDRWMLDDIICSKDTIQGRKNVIIYDYGENDDSYDKYDDCLKKFQKSSHRRIQDQQPIGKEFLEDVLKNSCF